MTVITEYRLKCDYCGHVSPVIQERGDLATGWERYEVSEPVEMFKGYDAIQRDPYIPAGITWYHFCASVHRVAWLAEREAKTA